MKNILIVTLLTFLLFIPSFAQTKTFEALEKENKALKKNKCKINYDKFKDVTLIISSLGGTNMPLTTIAAAFSFEGQTLDKSIESYLVSFTTVSIMRDTSLIFIADDERVKIGEPVSKNQPTTIMSLADVYRHTYEFTPEQFEKFASVEKVEYQIGNLQLTAQKDVSAKLKNLLTLAKLK